MDCLFCSIINKEIPAKTVYEDDNVIAFLDIFPVADGHVLVVPKKHYVELKDMPKNEIADLMLVINKLYPIVESVTKCDGIHLLENYGCSQEIKHVHFHIIPTFKDKAVMSFNKIGNSDNLDSIQQELCKLTSNLK